VIWEAVERAHARNGAYNLEVVPRDDGSVRAIFYARAPAESVEIAGVGVLDTKFGGCELTGDFVVERREVFDWLGAHPEEAARLSEARLRETTRR
jgi:hypothetical protein